MALSLVGNDIYDPFYMPPPVFQRLSAYCIHRSPVIVANSTVVQERLISHFGAVPDTIIRIPYGIDVERFQPAVDGQSVRQRYGIRPDQRPIFALQRLEKRKGLDILLKAMQQISSRFPDVRVLIGGKGRGSEALRGLCEELGLQEQITFCGFVAEDEKPLYYAAADIFAMHSYYEGLGIALAEASATGLPVVSTRAGGTVDIVIDGKGGVLVGPGDVAALAQALSALIADPRKRQAMGEVGRQHVVENLSLETVTAAYMQVFEQAWSEQHQDNKH